MNELAVTATSPPLHETWTERLLDVSPAPAAPLPVVWIEEAQRLAAGLGLAGVFGAAIGLRAGGLAIATDAFGVALGVLAVCALAVPALAILLALVDASVDALGLARATARGAASTGLLLAGFAPGAALFALTVEDAISLTCVAVGGLALAGLLGMRSFVQALLPSLQASPSRARRLGLTALPVFLVFAAILGARIWWVMIPIVRGG